MAAQMPIPINQGCQSARREVPENPAPTIRTKVFSLCPSKSSEEEIAMIDDTMKLDRGVKRLESRAYIVLTDIASFSPRSSRTQAEKYGRMHLVSP